MAKAAKRKNPKVPAKTKIARATHIHRSRAHTASVTRTRQARRDKQRRSGS